MSYRIDIGTAPPTVLDDNNQRVPYEKATITQEVVTEHGPNGAVHRPGKHTATVKVNGKDFTDVPVFSSKDASKP